MKYVYKVITTYVEEFRYSYLTTPTKKRCVYWKSDRGVEAWCSGASVSDLNSVFRNLPASYKSYSGQEYYYVVEVYE